MGQRLAFPPKLLQEFLTDHANNRYFDPAETTIWQGLLRLFRSMDKGTAFSGQGIHRFNGGLFAADPVLEALQVSNRVFCQHGQGQNQASIESHKRTVLYLCATYNYANDLGESAERDAGQFLGLYTLGRIFEQSITELEILEAEADGRPSVNKASRRKTDGVYYTPEWIVDRVVDGTIGPALAAMRRSCGWADDAIQLPSRRAVHDYLIRLRTFTVLDPACGSGAFLISALRYLADEWRKAWAMQRQVSTVADPVHEPESDAALTLRLLRENIFGVDIDPASLEIAQLALWLHTARGDQPLASLEDNLKCGNTLVGPDFYVGMQRDLLSDAERERVNAFDWRTEFPSVAAQLASALVVEIPGG